VAFAEDLVNSEDPNMSSKKTQSDVDAEKMDQIVAESRRSWEQREQSYRAKALKIHPWVCARCGREFSGKRLRELTVHHKDHNHQNNPEDGSNWELLCLYCHDNEHSRQEVAESYGEAPSRRNREPASTYRPFADLRDLWKNKES
jgi:5-methylcytosine-specific restriction endonuclease McrA